MATMRYLDLSYEGRQVAERSVVDNGKLPHGAYRGTRKHPPSHLSYDKGREFKDKLDAEVNRIIEQEDVQLQGESPSWALLVHREPSYTDESPLFVQNYMAASKHAKAAMAQRQSLLPNKSKQPLKYNGTAYYRPNRMHQYLTATELKTSSEDNVDVKYGRPTRTTLLRARQRSSSASTNSYEQRRELYQRVDELKSGVPTTPSAEYLQLRSLREGESLHSYLTGARYNRTNCLDSKSVEHSGVFMPRHNPAFGMFFRGPKGQEYIQEFEATTTSPALFTPPNSARRRPVTAPTAYRRAAPATNRPVTAQRHTQPPERKSGRKTHARSMGDVNNRAKEPKLNVVGCGLQLGIGSRDLYVRLQRRPETARASLDRRGPLEETYRVNQPPPTPTEGTKASLISDRVDPSEERDLLGDVRGDVLPEGDDEKENRTGPTVQVPNDIRGEIEPSVGGESMTVKNHQDEVKEGIPVKDEKPENVGTKEESRSDDVQNTDVEESKEKESHKEGIAIKEEENEEIEPLTDDVEKEDTLDEQAKELVEEIVEKAVEEVGEDVAVDEAKEGEEGVEEEKEVNVEEEEEEENVNEEVEEEQEEEQEETKSVKEVRFFITEEGGEQKGQINRVGSDVEDDDK